MSDGTESGGFNDPNAKLPSYVKVQMERVFTAGEISNIFCGFMEGNDMSAAWVHDVSLEHTDATEPRGNLVWYGHPIVFEKAWLVTVEYDDPNSEEGEGNNEGRFEMNPTNFAEGLKIMSEKYPRHFADLVNDNADAITYDIVLQCVVLKDVVYG